MKKTICFQLKPFVAVCALALLPTLAHAGLSIPYGVDAQTLHLWHFDGASTNLDGTTNILAPDSVVSSSITLTNLGQPNPGVPPYTNTSYGNLSSAGLTNSMRTTDKFGMAYGGLFPDVSPFGDTNTGAFTFEAVVRFNNNPLALPNNMEIIAGDQPGGIANRGWQFRVDNAGHLEFNLLGGSGSDNDFKPSLPSGGPDAAVAGQWYHVAVTGTGNAPTNGDTPNQLKLYWTLLDANRTNADLLGTFTMTRALNGTTASGPGTVQPAFAVGGSGRKITPGGNGVANGEGLIGNVDEVRISAIARSANSMAFTNGGPLNPPSFLANPPAKALIGFGKTLRLSTVVVGTLPLTYQWQATNSSGGGFTNVPSQTDSTLLIGNIDFAATGLYRLLVTNTFGSRTSSVAQVTVGAAFSELFNTGVNTSGVLDTNTLPNNPDPHYKLIQSSDVNHLGPDAIVWSMFAYPIASFGGNFANPNDSSAWIGAQANNYISPVGQYTYRITFLLDSVDVAQPASLSGIWYANEFGNDILLNGVPTGNSLPALTSSAGKFSVPFAVTNGFVAGLNTLDFVTTRSAAANGSYQESALRVDMSDPVVELTAVGVALPPGQPNLTTQPANVTVRENGHATFSVVALGRPPLSYQWYADGTLLTGSTNRTLSLNPVFTGGQGTNFTVVVSNDSGSVTSTPAAVLTLTTNRPPIPPPTFHLATYLNTPVNLSVATIVYSSSDPDNDPISFTAFDLNSTNIGTVTLNGINLTYMPPTDYLGPDQYSYTLSDSIDSSIGLVQINVVPLLAPTVGLASKSGNDILFSGSGGSPGGSFTVLTSTDVTTPLPGWTVLSTGTFDGSGKFTITTPYSAGTPQRYYTVQVP